MYSLQNGWHNQPGIDIKEKKTLAMENAVIITIQFYNNIHYWSKDFLVLLKEVTYAHRDCICLLKIQ